MESSLSPMILYYWINAVNTNDSISNKTMCDYTQTSLHTLLYLVLMSISVLVRPTGVIFVESILYNSFNYYFKKRRSR